MSPAALRSSLSMACPTLLSLYTRSCKYPVVKN
jgi:hypothetical protein